VFNGILLDNDQSKISAEKKDRGRRVDPLKTNSETQPNKWAGFAIGSPGTPAKDLRKRPVKSHLGHYRRINL
jgi:hypothetical protein